VCILFKLLIVRALYGTLLMLVSFKKKVNKLCEVRIERDMDDVGMVDIFRVSLETYI